MAGKTPTQRRRLTLFVAAVQIDENETDTGSYAKCKSVDPVSRKG